MAANTCYQQGENFYKFGEYLHAIHAIDGCIYNVAETNPMYVKSKNLQGLCYHNLGRNKEAQECFESVKENTRQLADGSMDEDKWNSRGVALHYLQEYYEAIKCFDRATWIMSTFAEAYYNKGTTLLQIGNYHEAIRCFDIAMQLKPNYLEALNSKGLAFNELAEYDSALECFTQVIENTKSDPRYYLHDYALNNKAWSNANKGRTYEALDDLKKMLSRNKRQAFVLDTKGFIFYQLKDYDKALDQLNQAIYDTIAGPEDKYVFYHKGNIYSKKKKYDEAIECYDRAIDIDSNFAEAYNDKAVTLYYKDDYNGAIENVKKALRIKPTLTSAYENLSRLTLRNAQGVQNFWDFWKASPFRKAIAIFLLGSAIGVGIYSLLLVPSENIESEKDYVNGVLTNTTIKTTTTKPPTIPEPYLIVIGLVILILLLPQIKTAKVGSIEFELSPFNDARENQPNPTS